MEFILRSIESAAHHGHFLPAIVTALTIPDIAGAVDSPGAGSQSRYAKWTDTWFSPRFPSYAMHRIDGLTIYSLRCQLLHEGLSDPSRAVAARKSDAASRKRLIAFNVGPGVVMHLVTVGSADEDKTILRAETFCVEMTTSAREWMKSISHDEGATGRLAALVDIRMSVPGLGQGFPMLCAAVSNEPSEEG